MFGAAARGAAVLVALVAVTAPAAACRALDHDGTLYTVCEVEAGRDDVRLWHAGPEGRVLGSFSAVETLLAGRGETLAFAMNGGMYHPDRSPVGLYIEQGREMAPLVTGPGPGNFGMVPNGVFCVRDDGFAVIEAERYAADPPPCRYATQSGPMLVIDGALHPRFLPNSTSRFVRNGVGVSRDGRHAQFAISEEPVTFHEFARLFRDGFGVAQALFFDGNISRLHAPAIGRSDWGRRMGPIVGVARPAE